GLTEQREARGLARLGGQGGVAQAAEAPLGDDDLLPGADEVGEDLAVFVDDDGSRRDVEGQVLATSAVPVVAGAVVAALGAHVRGEAEIQQGVYLGVDFEDDVSAVAAVAAVRPAQGHELLAAHGVTAIAAIAGFEVQNDPVNEVRHGCKSFLRSDSNFSE